MADPLTVAAVLRRAVRLWPGRAAVAGRNGRISYRQLGQQADRLSARLFSCGLEYGDRVAVLADNQPQYVAAYFGVPAEGLVLLPLNTRLTVQELTAQLADSGTRVLLHDGQHAEVAHAVTAGTDVRCMSLDTADATAGASGGEFYGGTLPGGTDKLEIAPDDLAYIYYTSGSTGQPKGVMLSHRQVLSGALSSTIVLALDGRDVWLHAGPLFHLADAWAIWGLTWVGGCHVTEKFDATPAVQWIERLGVTRTLLVPTALDMLVSEARVADSRLSSLRSLGYGGAPMPVAVYERARSGLACPLIPTYGATELSGLCTALPVEESIDDGAAWDTIGRETPLHLVTLVGPDGSQVPDGQVGEMCVTSPAVMTGYWQQPGSTAVVLTGRTLATGDLASRDNAGRIIIHGRLKDMIITGGENVAALEVERVLALHPAVAQVAVTGHPDPHWGETVCAAVVPQPGAVPTLEELRSFARDQLAGYKLPRILKVMDQLPHTGSGKIDKASLRQTIQEASADVR